MIGRREFITLLGGAAAGWPLAARAQQSDRVRRIGVFQTLSEADRLGQTQSKAFERGLRQHGWDVGRHVRIDYRFGGADTDRMPSLARELVELRPEVIFAVSTPMVAAVLRETSTVPIVFALVSDPIGSGFVQSFARPGGNVTGFTNLEPGITGKCLELLKEIAPSITRVILPFNPETATNAAYFLRSIDTARTSFAVSTVAAPVRSTAEFERVVEDFARDGNGGMVVLSDPFAVAHRQLIVSIAELNRLPTVYPFRSEGGLMSYAVDAADQHRRAASYVDRILRGSQPADLPVQAPTKFELVINLKTAKALGLDVPPTLLARADEVID
jgi:putative ABC transport system substrate-binding protein